MAGGTTGAIAKTVVAPLERCKILFQTGRLQGGGLVPTLKLIWAREGPKGLFRGNGAMVARIIPYSAVHFGAYEEYRRVIGNAVYGSAGAPAHAPPVLDLAAGAAAGASAVMLTYPLDLARTRLAFRLEGPHSKKKPAAASASVGHAPAGSGSGSGAGGGAGGGAPRVATTAGGGGPRTGAASSPAAPPPASPSQSPPLARPGIVSTLSSAYRAKGFRGLYVGVGASFYGILPYAGLKFYVYQTLKGAYMRSQEERAREESEAQLRETRRAAAVAWAHANRSDAPGRGGGGDALEADRPGASTSDGSKPVDRHHLLVPYSRHLPRSTVLSPEEEAGLGVGSTSDASATLAEIVLEESIERCERATALQAPSEGISQASVAEAVEETLEKTLPGADKPRTDALTTPQAQSGPISSSSPNSHASTPPSARLPVPLMLANGAVSGLIAQTVTYPFDVVRRRRQVEGLREAGSFGMAERATPGGTAAPATPTPASGSAAASAPHRPEVFRSTPRAILEIARASGWRSLYAGLLINYIKVIPSTAIGFAAYDYLKSALGLPTHL